METTCQGGNASTTSVPGAESATQEPPTSGNASNHEAKGDPAPKLQGDGDLSGENGKKSPAIIERAGVDPLALAEESDDGHCSDNDMAAGLPSDEDHERDELRFYVDSMNTDKMFKAYMMRLERHETGKMSRGHGHDQRESDQKESEHEKSEHKESPKGAEMMRGIMGYTKSLEDRIVKLEATERGSRKQRSAGDGNDKGKTEKPATISDELLVKVGFFDVNYEPEFNGHCLEGGISPRGPTGPLQVPDN